MSGISADRLSHLHIGLMKKSPAVKDFNPGPEDYVVCGLSLFEHKAGETKNIKCQKSGQYLIILMAKRDFLTLCEVEVFGYLGK